MINHFKEFTIVELEDAYEYFSGIEDYGGCTLVSDAFANKVSFNLVNFEIL